MAFTRVYHVGQLDQSTVSELIGVIRGLGSILGTSSDKNTTIISLDRAEPNGDIEVNIQYFSLLSFVIHIVKSDKLLIKLEEMDLISLCHIQFFFLIPFISPLDASYSKIISHSELRVPVKTNILSCFLILVGKPPWFIFWSTTGASIPILTWNELLEQKLMYLDVAIIHNQVFSEEVFQRIAIDNLKFTVFLEPINHLVDS